MKQAYIIHGYTANPGKHWFPWLERELVQRGIRTERLAMPDSDNPTPQAWLDYMRAQIRLNAETVLIGHSLGCIALLNYLQKTHQRAKGLILVSGFYQPLPNLPELDDFVNFCENPPACDLAAQRIVIAALNDKVVNHHFSSALAEQIHADYLRLPTGGHFLDREGVTELHAVLEAVERMLAD